MTKRIAFAFTAPALAALALFACDGETLTVGDSSTNGVSGADSGSIVWKGYVENFQLPSGSDRVTLTFHSDGSGSISFGDVLPPAPGSNPDDPEDQSHPYYDLFPSADEAPNVVEGFVFTILNLSIDGERRRFSFAPEEAWGQWCSSQKQTYPLLDASGKAVVYGCKPPPSPGEYRCSYVVDDAGTMMPMQCGAPDRCTATCACDAVGCGFSLYSRVNYKFDLAFEDQRASGSSPYGFLRLTRSP